MSLHEIDSTDDIVCPHCGVHYTPDEYDGGGGVWDCDECGKSFTYEVEYEVTFSTRCKKEDHVLNHWQASEKSPGWEYAYCEVCSSCIPREIGK